MTSAEQSDPVSASCSLRVVPPLDLTVLHPSPQNGTLFLQSNRTRLLLRVQSRYETRAFYPASNSSAAFHPDCPQEFPSRLCHPATSEGSWAEAAEPSVYAVLDLSLKIKDRAGPVQVELKVSNNVTEANLTVLVQLEDSLRGLVVQPHPAQRVLMESVVVSAPPPTSPPLISLPSSTFICMCFRATRPQSWKALIPLLNGRWMTSRFSPTTTRSSMSSTSTLTSTSSP